MTLAPLTLTLLALFLQAGAPARPAQPASPASPPTSSAPAASTQPTPPPAAPPRPMVPVPLASPSDAALFLHIFSEEKKLAEENQAFYKQAQDHMNADQAKMQGYAQILKDEFEDLRKKESWGPDVQFNPQTEKFEKPLPGAGSPPSAGTHNKDTKQPVAPSPSSPTAAPEKKPQP